MFGHIEEGRLYIFYGKMGSGKSANAVRELAAFHRRGQPVWVNFPILKWPTENLDKRAPIWRSDDPEDILGMEGGLFIIDEAYRTINARKWASLSEETFLGFTHIRKLHMTGIIIAQSYKRLDVSIREVATKARCFQGGGLFGHRYPFIEYDVDEEGNIVKYEDPTLSRIAEEKKGTSWLRKSTYGLYDTDNLFDSIRRKITWRSAIQEYGPEGATGSADGEMAQAERVAPIISPSALECAGPIQSPPGAGA